MKKINSKLYSYIICLIIIPFILKWVVFVLTNASKYYTKCDYSYKFIFKTHTEQKKIKLKSFLNVKVSVLNCNSM